MNSVLFSILALMKTYMVKAQTIYMIRPSIMNLKRESLALRI
jgi:hypothetical protein